MSNVERFPLSMNKPKCSLKNMKRNLRAREALNESEQKKLDNEKKMVHFSIKLNAFFYLRLSHVIFFLERNGNFGADES